MWGGGSGSLVIVRASWAMYHFCTPTQNSADAFWQRAGTPTVNITGWLPGQGQHGMPKLSLLLGHNSSFPYSLPLLLLTSLRILWFLFFHLPFQCSSSQGSVLKAQLFFLSIFILCDVLHSHGFGNHVDAHISQISFSFPSIHLSTCLLDSSTRKPYSHLISNSTPSKPNSLSFFKNTNNRDFPGGPVVRTPCFHCRGPRFDLWLGIWLLFPQFP